MDSWWENLDRAYAAWTTAIAEAGLEGKYRELEQGHLFWADTDLPDSPNLLNTDSLASLPLPWDHLDTGIDKRWLAEDLQRALAEATVPDCSFEGCSHCGVCGVDFGHNEVVPPPPIPEFTGQFQPNPNRVQRLRVRFGKQGDLRLLSHLDLLRLFDRAIRRAALPIAYSGGYHPMPRMIPASALSLGLTSEGELMDLELTQAMDPQVALEQLQAQFPPDVPIYAVESVAPESPPVTEAVQTAQFRVQLAIVPSTASPDEEAPQEWQPDPAIVQTWITELLAQSSVEVELTSKSGKAHRVNLRERLQTLEWVGLSDRHLATQQPLETPSILLDYEGNYRNDGNLLRPEHLLMMLETIAQDRGLELQLLHAHRLSIGL
jgi:radical SAM-linked protein